MRLWLGECHGGGWEVHYAGPWQRRSQSQSLRRPVFSMPRAAFRGRSPRRTVVGPWRSTVRRVGTSRRVLERRDPPARRLRAPTCRWRSLAGLHRPETGPSAPRLKLSDRARIRCRQPSRGEPPRSWCRGWAAGRPRRAASRPRLPDPDRACRAPSVRRAPPIRARAHPTHRWRLERGPLRRYRMGR